ncbi:Sodium/calcium exchanger protein-domain-containing protein [Absidia repens]|uniref:Sodium/calcium exchanger protein-domain-containing protein n=1 Tax=Absidia repens TaxID=90262 RepID=A0A1X2IF77_9FUNG|nr:Sodium/calcium exchanger protein-domain-containing protein [Absidia repens]
MPSFYKTTFFCALIALVILGTKITTYNANTLFTNLTLTKSHCSHIELQEDQCAFVKKSCHGFSALYLEFYYCSPLWKPVVIGLLLTGLFLLFGAISVVASDFFCRGRKRNCRERGDIILCTNLHYIPGPNLQTIASKLELSESLAGVTVLAFGNGSPDLFGTFSAMDTGSGSMAIGEIIGAAFFIVAVITGCMGIIRPFQSKRIIFMRDASFLTGAVALLTWIVYHGKIYWYHGLALIAYYVAYVVTVLLSSYQWGADHDDGKKDTALAQNLIDETSRLLGTQDHLAKPPRLNIPARGFSSSFLSDQQQQQHEPHLGHIIRPMSPSITKPSLRIDTSIQQQQQQQQQQPHSALLPRTTSTNGSISTIRPYRRAMTPRVGIRTSLFGAIEFTSQVNTIRRANSTQQVLATPSLMVPTGDADQQQLRRRQTSVPHGFWQQQRPPNLSFNSLSANPTPTTGRQRTSTTTDQRLLTANSASLPLQQPPANPQPHNGGLSASSLPRPTTPESTNSSTGVAEDYFAYLSTYQPHHAVRRPSTNTSPVPSHLAPLPPRLSIQLSSSADDPQQRQAGDGPDIPIPEIRLAPPVMEQYHTPLTSTAHSPHGGNDPHRLPSPNNTGSPHLMTPSHSFASAATDDDCYVSARQSPELYPTPFDHDRSPATSPVAGTKPTAHRHSMTDDDDDDDDEHKFLSGSAKNINDDTSNSWYSSLAPILFPTLQEWSSKSWFSCLSSLVAMPLVLVFTLTLPVAEAENVKVDEVEVMDDDYMYGEYRQSPSPTPYGSIHIQPPPPPSSSSFNNTQHLPLPLEQPQSSSYLTVPASESDHYLGQQKNHHPHPQSDIKYSHSMHSTLDITDADLQQGWCRWLLAVQAVFSITFIFCILVFNEFIEAGQIIIGVGIGFTLSLVVLATTQSKEPPSWFWLLSFAGFFVALNWIFLLANAMVGLLQAIGKIYDISEAIMGLTVFAFGNSVGDLVSNIAIAKMGFPNMSISACYAGPLLNMVLGVGVSSTYQIWKSHGHPYLLVIPPTILVSAGGLLTVLLSTLFVVNMNEFHVNKQLGYWTISVYAFCCITNLLLEFGVFKS